MEKEQKGFTLIELMVTIAIVATVTMLAAPTFSRLIQDYRVTTQTNDLLGSINIARSEAIKRGTQVSIEPISGNFTNGWRICQGDCTSGSLLREHDAVSQIVTNTASQGKMVFDSIGRRLSPGATTEVAFQLRPNNCINGENRVRKVQVLSSGSANVVRALCS